MSHNAPLLPNLSNMPSLQAPKAFAPTRRDVLNTLYGEFGPPEDASKKEKYAWKAWKNAIANEESQDEIDQLRKELEKVMKEVGREM